MVACGSPTATSQSADTSAVDNEAREICVPGRASPHACDPADTKKTTVCHIPPGNPANAHTICVGNAAVPAHLDHGDHLGSCCAHVCDGGTPPPPPPPPSADLGTPPPPPPPPAGDLGSPVP